MKLTCALIVAALFLTACQLIATDDSRGMQKHLAKRSRAKSLNYRLTRSCDPPGYECELWENDCCDACKIRHNNPNVCSDE
uniref:Ctr_O1_3 conopeptide n=2 Tax=Conus tribblei TaxID=101761 RepID=A0A0K8TV35_CONTD